MKPSRPSDESAKSIVKGTSRGSTLSCGICQCPTMQLSLLTGASNKRNELRAHAGMLICIPRSQILHVHVTLSVQVTLLHQWWRKLIF